MTWSGAAPLPLFLTKARSHLWEPWGPHLLTQDFYCFKILQGSHSLEGSIWAHLTKPTPPAAPRAAARAKGAVSVSHGCIALAVSPPFPSPVLSHSLRPLNSSMSFFHVCVCVCVHGVHSVYMYIHVCERVWAQVWGCICVCAYTNLELASGMFFNHSPPLYWWTQGLSLNPKFADFWLSGLTWAPQSLLSKCCNCRWLSYLSGFHVGSGSPNSGHLTCVPGALFTEPSPWLLLMASVRPQTCHDCSHSKFCLGTFCSICRVLYLLLHFL